MGISLKIVGLDNEGCSVELDDELLTSIEYLHHTSTVPSARTYDPGYTLLISGKVMPMKESGTGQEILELSKWAHLPYEPGTDYYRNVYITYEKDEQVIREINFTNAYVLDYEEGYDNKDSVGMFKLSLSQKKDQLRKINFGQQEESDTAVKNTPKLPTTHNLVMNWGKKSIDGGSAPTRKDILLALFTKKLDTLPGIDEHKDYRDAVINRFMSGTPIAQELFLKYVKNNSLKELTNEDGSFYRDSKDTVFLNIAKDYTRKGTGVVFFHEYGHYLDDAAGDLSNDAIFRKCIMNDFRSAVESRANAMFLRELKRELVPVLGHMRYKLEDIMNPDYWNGTKETWIDFKKLYENISDELTPHELSAISDLYSGLSIVKVGKETQRIVGNWAHPVEYWSADKDKVFVEAFAHCYEAQFNSVRRANLRKYFPTAYKRFEELLEEAYAK